MARPYNGQPASVHSLRVVCAGGMGRLAKKLRKCGIDTDLLTSPMTNEDLIESVSNLEDGRILILKSSVYNQVSGFVSIRVIISDSPHSTPVIYSLSILAALVLVNHKHNS